MLFSGGPSVKIFLFVFYLVSHCAGFAGFALILFVKAYEDEKRLSRYAAFLLAFFLYVALRNSGFICSTFLGFPEYFQTLWYFALDMLLTAALMASYSMFFHALPKTTPSRRRAVALLSFSSLPLALFALGSLAPTGILALIGIPQADALSIRIFFMKLAVILVALLLAYSTWFLFRNLKEAVDEDCASMMKFTIVSNLAFIVPFLAQTRYNFDASNAFIPISAENVYMLVLHLANIGVLAIGVLVKREARAEEPSALRIEDLSLRERNILAFLIRGLGNKEIAAELGLSEYSVRNQISGLFKRFDVRNRVELVDLYRKTLFR